MSYTAHQYPAPAPDGFATPNPVVVLNNMKSGATLHCVSKKVPTFELSVTLSNLNRFSKLLHCWKAYEICHKTHTIIPTSP